MLDRKADDLIDKVGFGLIYLQTTSILGELETVTPPTVYIRDQGLDSSSS